jgi:hypothetical protein
MSSNNAALLEQTSRPPSMPQLEHESNRIRSTNDQREPMEYETRYMVENDRRDPINSSNQRIADEGIRVAQTFDCRDRKYVKELSEDRKFMGQITEWPNYWARFSSRVHLNRHLSVSDKARVLHQTIAGPAARTIACYNGPDELDYGPAIVALLDRYSRPNDIKAAEIKKYINRPKINPKNEYEELFDLKCELQVTLNRFKMMELPARICDETLLDFVLALLGSEAQIIFARLRTRTIQSLLQAIETRCQDLSCLRTQYVMIPETPASAPLHQEARGAPRARQRTTELRLAY